MIHIPPITDPVDIDPRLIAAAPELADACEWLIRAYQQSEASGSIDWIDLDYAYAQAMLALKKAGLQ